MADNKAEEAVKEANIKLKVYYSGKTPSECGVLEWQYNMEPLDEDHRPWLVKFFPDGESASCAQFVNSLAVYKHLSKGLAEILDAVIVNTKQREAMDVLVDHLLWGELGSDNANENDVVVIY